METATIDVPPGGHIRINAVGGDLRLTGCDSRRLEAQAGRRGGLRAAARGDVVEITCSAGCLVFVPADCSVEIGEVTGDARLTDVRGEIRLGSVGGDLRLRRLGQADIGRVGGDLWAQRVRGPLTLGQAGADVRLQDIGGDLELGSISGDLSAKGLTGGVRARVDGDVVLSLDPTAGSSSELRAGGDAAVRVPPGASLLVELQADGDLSLSGHAPSPEGGAATLTLGAGAASLKVTAAGDLAFSEAARVPPSDLASAITAQVEAALADVEAELVDAGLGSGDVGEQVRRALERALRPAGRGKPPGETAATGGGREREMILAMLADGRINAEEAEALFRALEGQG